MKTNRFLITSLLTGVLFGLGMVISGMTDPSRVIGFLDIAGQWDSSLLWVMVGAIGVFMPAYFGVIKKQSQPRYSTVFQLAKSTQIDKRLLIGATIFGLGWGAVGVCPGPAVSSLLIGNHDIWVFVAFMLAGLGVTHALLAIAERR